MMILSGYYLILVKALMITAISEEVILVIQKEKNIQIYLLCFFLNIVTNLIMNILLLRFYKNYFYLLITFEIVVIFIEAIGYYLIKKNFLVSLRIALLCNIASLLVGIVI